MNNKEYADGLRLLADWYEANPDIPNPGIHQNYTVNNSDEAVAVLKALGHCRKEYSGEIFKLLRSFGPLDAEFIFMRDSVCSRKVVGTETIPEEVVPAHTREIVEWECHPVLRQDEALAA